MSSSAIIMMTTWCGIVTIVTAYFFYKVLTSKKEREPDSYSENDPQS